MRLTKALTLLLAAITALPTTAHAQPGFGGWGDDAPAEVTLELAMNLDAVAPGDRLVVAVIFDHQPGWHVHTNDPVIPPTLAESGFFAIKTEVEPTKLLGASAGPVQWPEVYESIVRPAPGVEEPYGVFAGRAVAYLPLLVDDDATGQVTIDLRIAYQACDDAVCLAPEDVARTLTIPVVFEPTTPTTDGDFAGFDPAVFETATFAATTPDAGDPAPGPGPVDEPLDLLTRVIGELDRAMSHAGPDIITSTWVDYTPETLERALGSGRTVLVDFTAEWCINCKVFEAQVLDAEPTRSLIRGDDIVMLKVDMTGKNADGEALLKSLGRVGIPTWAVYSPDDEIEPRVIESYTAGAVRTAIERAQGLEPEAAAEDDEDGAQKWFGIIPIPQGGGGGLLVIAGLAALGGFVLNLTPCVLPVIPIKIMTISSHSGEHKGKQFFLGLMMAAGVVAFWAALGLPVALASGVVDPSRVFGLWYVTIPLGVLIVLLSLGVMGLFTLSLPQGAYSINPKADNAGGSFLFGIMTGVLGLPCFGFVAGALIPAAAALGGVAVMVIFTALGVGMAAPYLVLSAYPRLLGFVPKTGPASELVKQFLGLLMVAAGVYFFGTGLISLIDTYPFLGREVHLFFVSLAIVASGVWLAYRTLRITPSAPRRGVFGGLGLILAALGVWLSVSAASSKHQEHNLREAEFAKARESESARVAALEGALETAGSELRRVVGLLETAAEPGPGDASPATAILD